MYIKCLELNEVVRTALRLKITFVFKHIYSGM
jgi:hypothetical protein